MPGTLDTFLRLRHRLNAIREQDGLLFGVLNFSPIEAGLSNDLAELCESGVIAELRQDSDLVFLPSLAAGAVEATIDTGKIQGYFENYDLLIERHPDKVPETYRVWEGNGDQHNSYVSACDLLQLLKGRVEVWDATQRRFYFVDTQAIEVPLKYHIQDTANVVGQMQALSRFLASEHLDADTRWIFFRKAAVRVLRDIDKELRLGTLLLQLPGILDRAQQDYSLYLERFSFEDLVKTFDEQRLKFVNDLGQVVGSIQTALIAVPIGFFLIVEKFQTANVLVGRNVVLAGGGVIFCALLLVLSFNQGKILRNIRLALVDFEKEQSRKYTDRSSRLTDLLTQTWSQYRRVRMLLIIVRTLLLVFVLVIVLGLLWCSSPVWQKRWPYSQDDPVAVSPSPMATPRRSATAPPSSATSKPPLAAAVSTANPSRQP